MAVLVCNILKLKLISDGFNKSNPRHKNFKLTFGALTLLKCLSSYFATTSFRKSVPRTKCIPCLRRPTRKCNKWKNGWVDRQMDGWTDWHTNRQTIGTQIDRLWGGHPKVSPCLFRGPKWTIAGNTKHLIISKPLWQRHRM